MTYNPPGVTTSILNGAVPGSGTSVGLVVVLIGSAPLGPSAPTLITNKVDGLGTFGNDMVYSDLAGWTIPAALRLVYENAIGGLAPQVLVVRAGTTQAAVALTNANAAASPTPATWTATVKTTALGGASGNTLSLDYETTGGGTLTITPPAGSTLAVETYTGLGGTATWAAIAAQVNPRSQLVTITGTDNATVAQAQTGAQATTGGVDGQGATLSQINAAVDGLANLTYKQQPMHFLVPLYPDSTYTASTTAVGHALGAAIANYANGQRAQVIGSVANGTSVANITALATSLTGALDNNGDSGRCTLCANWAPQRLDPATNLPRLYPGWATAAAYAGMSASLSPSTPRGRQTLRGFVAMQENFSISDQTTLLTNGALTADPTAQLLDQVTTAAATSYRREASVQTQEDVWLADLANRINLTAIEIPATQQAGQYLDNMVGLALLGYQQRQWMASASHDTHQSTTDSRSWEVDITWSPIFPLRNVTLRAQMVSGATTPTTSIATF